MPNVPLHPPKRVSPFRKVAIGTWTTTYDPQVYGTLGVRMEKTEAYIKAFREKTGKRLTVTHMVTAAVAKALASCPEANAILRWNKIYLRKDVNISVLVVVPSEDGSKVDLSSAVVRKADQCSLLEQIEQLDAQVGAIKKGEDKAMKKSKDTIGMVPFMLMNLFMKLLAFLMYDLNLDMRWAGMPKNAFGGACVTNIGSLGLDTAYVPVVPYTRVPIWIAPGEIADEAVVEDGEVVPGRVMRINATFDHRFIDGYHAMVLSKTLRKVLENPFEELDSLEDEELDSDTGEA
jgi:pyruvate/2-oxoglutarate dehydrogenase complex dihydrolipoamide acyltransferase (E2) component